MLSKKELKEWFEKTKKDNVAVLPYDFIRALLIL